MLQPYVELDITSLSILPADWLAQVNRTIAEFGVPTNLTGASDLSRELEASYNKSVIVVMGDACQRELPWLRKLYDNELRDFVTQTFGRPYFAARDLRSSVNINCLRGRGASYEAHVDSNPLTGVLFVTDADERTGGILVFEQADGRRASVHPRAGHFIAFDARDIPHYVTPLQTDMDRISIPMNYYDHPERQYRPDGLDSYLYGSSTE